MKINENHSKFMNAGATLLLEQQPPQIGSSNPNPNEKYTKGTQYIIVALGLGRELAWCVKHNNDGRTRKNSKP
jgi:hypothetical protein